MILMIDNYDSFTYNLVQGLAALGADIKVVKNDQIDIGGISALNPEKIIFSPGPGNPDSAGVTLDAIRAFAGKVPLYGICLGHQAIAQAFGARITRAKRLMHGKASRISHDGKGLFAGMPQDFEAMRYHSLAVDRDSLPDCLEVSAVAEDGEIMGLRHKSLPVESLQYHPESIGTPEGERQLRNLLGIGIRDAEMTAAEVRSYRLFETLMSGRMSERELALLLIDGKDAPVSADELTGAARAMREAGVRINLADIPDAVDIVGTGGDGFSTFNVSTCAAFIAAGAGVTVAKHGNVAATSKCGSADVLAALGLNLEAAPEQVENSIRKVGVGFLFAKAMHPAMRYAARVRKTLGFRTVFNLLGPLTNPAGVRRHLIGVYDPKLTSVMAETLRRLGSDRAMVVGGDNGLDEISPSGLTLVSELKDGTVRGSLLNALDDFGVAYPVSAIGGGDAAENAQLLLAVLKGEDRGARRLSAVVNAAAAIVVGGKANTIREAMAAAEESIDSGRALGKLRGMIEACK